MACNIIINEAGQLRTTQFDSQLHYDIGDINFYVPEAIKNNIQLFLILKNKKNLFEIVELVHTGFQGSNAKYNVSINQNIRVNDEEVNVSLLLLNRKSETYKISNSIDMFINTEHYKLARQISIASQVGSQVQTLYSQILALTEENKKIYNQIVGRR